MAVKLSEALQYFLDEERLCAEIEFPDTGIDYAFMLKEEDWKVLKEKWEIYSDEWKKAITYFAGFSYLNQSACILIKALHHGEIEIITESLFAIYESLKAELDNEGKTNYVFTERDKEKIILEIEKRKNELDLYPELIELKQMMTDKSANK